MFVWFLVSSLNKLWKYVSNCSKFAKHDILLSLFVICFMHADESQPYFLRMLEDVSVMEKKSAEFECEVFPINSPVEWFVNGKQVPLNSERYHVSAIGGRHRLIILDTSKSDEGRVSVMLGDLESYATLFVEGEKRLQTFSGTHTNMPYMIKKISNNHHRD